MTRYLLDTSIFSNVTRPSPSALLVSWMSEQADTDLVISALTIAEIRRGLLQKPAGKKRAQLAAWFAVPKDRNRCSLGGSLPSTKMRV